MATEREKMLAGEMNNPLDPGLVAARTRAVIGTGSVVTRDVPEGVFEAGNPSRVIRAIEN
jgi:hypothetical protein